MKSKPKVRYHVYYLTTKGWRAVLSFYNTLADARDIAEKIAKNYGKAIRISKMTYTTEIVEESKVCPNN